jgi:hypothetical protein
MVISLSDWQQISVNSPLRQTFFSSPQEYLILCKVSCPGSNLDPQLPNFKSVLQGFCFQNFIDIFAGIFLGPYVQFLLTLKQNEAGITKM